MQENFKRLLAEMRQKQVPLFVEQGELPCRYYHPAVGAVSSGRVKAVEPENAGRVYSAEELQKMAAMLLSGDGIHLIADALGRRPSAVWQTLRSLDLLQAVEPTRHFTECVPNIRRHVLQMLNIYTDKCDWYSQAREAQLPSFPVEDPNLRIDLQGFDTVLFHRGNTMSGRMSDSRPSFQQLPKEPIMATTTDIKIVTKHYIGGVDTSHLTDAQIFGMIAAKEKELAELDKIETKSTKLDKAKAEMRADIDALAAFLDAR